MSRQECGAPIAEKVFWSWNGERWEMHGGGTRGCRIGGGYADGRCTLHTSTPDEPVSRSAIATVAKRREKIERARLRTLKLTSRRNLLDAVGPKHATALLRSRDYTAVVLDVIAGCRCE